jgi:hypothetical protein
MRILIIIVAILIPAFAQAQAQEPVVNFAMPRSQADALERLLGSLPVSQAGVLYFSVQNAITASANAELKARQDAFTKSVIDKHDEDLKKQTAPVPAPAQEN